MNRTKAVLSWEEKAAVLFGSRDKDPRGRSRSPFCLPGPKHGSRGAVIIVLNSAVVLVWVMGKTGLHVRASEDLGKEG